jgi:hypothetical protein
MDTRGLLPPVDFPQDWAPVDHPQYIPPWPGNLPAAKDRPTARGTYGQGGALPNDGTTILPPGTPIGGPGAGDGAPIVDPHHYAFIVEGQLNAGLASLRLIEQPAGHRNYLMIRNNGAVAANLFVSFGRDASANSPILLTQNQILLLDTVVPQDDVYVFASVAATAVAYAYSTIP